MPGRFDRKTIEQKVQSHLAHWRGLLRKHVEDGRQFLREALTAPLRFTPEGQSYRFEGELALGRLLGAAGAFAPFDSSLMPASWNRIASWLQQMEGLRRAA